jgi:hypothetical protein
MTVVLARAKLTRVPGPLSDVFATVCRAGHRTVAR